MPSDINGLLQKVFDSTNGALRISGAVSGAVSSIAGSTGAVQLADISVEPYGRVTFSNANATIAPTTVYLAQIGTLSAPRVVTLPGASAVPAGWEVVIADQSGTVTATNTLTITAAGADTINAGTTEVVVSAYAWRRFISDGVSAWLFDAGIVRLGAAQTMTNKTLTSPVLNTGVSGTAIDTDSTFAANSDTILPSQKAVKTATALLAPKASPTFTGTATAPAVAVSGLTGSTAANRMVGATATGAPASGAHLVGDFGVTQDGHLFICTTAGTPGTFTVI